jgi:hypothetical protein
VVAQVTFAGTQAQSCPENDRASKRIVEMDYSGIVLGMAFFRGHASKTRNPEARSLDIEQPILKSSDMATHRYAKPHCISVLANAISDKR